MFNIKIVVAGMGLSRLAKLLDKIAQKYVASYTIKKLNEGVQLDAEMIGGKALMELQRRLRIAQTKSGKQISIQILEVTGRT